MDYSSKNNHSLNRDGTFQSERFPKALAADYVKIDERSFSDLVKQVAEYAKLVRFYNDRNEEDGDWRDFFEEIYDYEQKKVKFISTEELEAKANVSPHLALLLSFLRLFSINQQHLNGLTKKHLDFYYRQILGLQSRKEQPDCVPVFFEAEKNAIQVMVPAGTRFPAGNDRNGKTLYYVTENDLIVNRAKVDAVKGLAVKKNNGKITGIYISDEILHQGTCEGNTGEEHFMCAPCSEEARIGFAVASPLFHLPEGRREIILSFADSLSPKGIRVEYSSETGWTEVKLPDTQQNSKQWIICIDTGQPAVTPYRENIHGGSFRTVHPVFRFTLENDTVNFDDAYKELSKTTIEKIEKIAVIVNDVKSLLLQNDLGRLDHTKSFLPFGPRPVKDGSVLYIGSHTVFNKYLDRFDIIIDWKGLPEDMRSYYCEYSNDISDGMEKFGKGHYLGQVYILDDGEWKSSLKESSTEAKLRNEHEVSCRKTYSYTSQKQKNTSDFTYNQLSAYDTIVKSGLIRIDLDFDFGHSVFQQCYTKAVLDSISKNDVTLPKPPYTPECKSLCVDYASSANVDSKNHQVFQIGPFGSVELKDKQDRLIPEFAAEGYLFIAIQGISDPAVLSLYFRMNSRSCSTDKVKKDDAVPEWYYLSYDTWEKFDLSEIIRDTTAGLSHSGNIEFNPNARAFTPHTIMPDRMVWLKAAISGNCDTFPALETVATQVTEAIYTNLGNESSHLGKGLPAGSITKPEYRIPGIKKVTQPYVSSGGRPEESTDSFYTRVSERLRHKNRSWNIWDYERLVLENFPSVLRAKCIPCVNEKAECQAGSVAVVLFPDCNAIPQQDILKPVVNRSLLAQVQEFLSSHSSPAATIHVIDPEYEEICIKCPVLLRAGFHDKLFYQNQLNTALVGFLSPWITNQMTEQFVNILYQSQITHFIEEQSYIDSVKFVRTTIRSSVLGFNDIICGSKANVILTSARTHHITIETLKNHG